MIRKKLSICIVLSIALILTSLPAYASTPNLELKSKGAILIDMNSGVVMYEKNAHEKLYPASMTKIMTLLLAMDYLEQGKIKLTDETTISNNATSMGGSQLWLEEGEVQTIGNLIKAVAVASANDGAVALGEALEGTVEGFVEKMNEKAKSLGMANTNFMNPHGLHHDEHYTTPYDVSIMSRELLKYPDIYKWLTIWTDTIEVGRKNKKTIGLTNHNKLVRHYPGATGIKTGYTSPAMHCVSASAKKGETHLISVIMAGPTSTDRFNDARKLLDYGFANYNTQKIVESNEKVGEIEITKGSSEKINAIAKNEFYHLLKKGTNAKIDKELNIEQKLSAPLKKGQKVGELIIKINDEEVGRVDIISETEVRKLKFSQLFRKNIRKILNKI